MLPRWVAIIKELLRDWVNFFLKRPFKKVDSHLNSFNSTEKQVFTLPLKITLG